jgi:uncharacterized protein (UPF0305 family)
MPKSANYYAPLQNDHEEQYESVCQHCGMEEEGYVICRHPVWWKAKDGVEHLILCGLDSVLKLHNYPEEDSEKFNGLVVVVQLFKELKECDREKVLYALAEEDNESAKVFIAVLQLFKELKECD